MLSPDCPALIGVETPALVIDAAALDANVARMAQTAKLHKIGLRPHAKTHKSAEIARRQLSAGAVGICCATVLEAETLAAAGVAGLLITAPTMGAAKFARVAKLHASLHAKQPLMIVVDHPAQVEGLAGAVAANGQPLGVLVDIDVGQARTGVTSQGSVVDLANAIAARPNLRFAGIQGYGGHTQHTLDPAERRRSALAAGGMLRDCIAALNDARLPPQIITGSGTGAHLLDANGPYTELQAGSYVFMDADYARIVDEQGHAPPFAPSLFVLATVVSVNRPEQITVDAGTKALATNGPPPCVMIGAPAGSSYRFSGDEHGTISIPAGATAPKLGDRLLIGATHCDPTVNLHACYRVVEDGDRLSEWLVLGRYGPV